MDEVDLMDEMDGNKTLAWRVKGNSVRFLVHHPWSMGMHCGARAAFLDKRPTWDK